MLSKTYFDLSQDIENYTKKTHKAVKPQLLLTIVNCRDSNKSLMLVERHFMFEEEEGKQPQFQQRVG
jgi:hypothetical protein